MSKVLKYLGLANLALLAGCGGSQPQTNTMGAGIDPFAANGSLGTGPTKGNLAKKQPDLGLDANLNGFKAFDDASVWSRSIEKAAVEPNSAKIIAKIGGDKPLTPAFGAYGPNKVPFGIPYMVVSSDAPKVAVNFADTKGSDPGPYPFPAQMPIEATEQAHAIVLDRDSEKLYETAGTKPDGTAYAATSGTVWDMRAYSSRKPTQASADPSGLPVFPMLLRFEEVSDIKGVNHPLRVTLANVGKGAVLPATRSSGVGTDADLPAMGTHFRLKKSFNVAKFSPNNQAILVALKKYGMILSGTGPDFAISGTPDQHWMDTDLAELKKVTVSDFEVLKPPPAPKLSKKEQAAADKAAALQTAAAPAQAVAAPKAQPSSTPPSDGPTLPPSG